MPFTVEEFHDLVRLLEEHPQWRAELRRLLLTEELLELPALVREWVEAQREFEARTEERFQALAEEVRELARVHREFEARTEERFQALAEEVRKLAEAQREFEVRTEERLGNLEVRLREFEARTEERLGNLEVRLREFEARTEERFQALVEAQVRTEQRLGELAQQVRSLLDWQRGEAGRREGERYERNLVRRAVMLFAGGAGGTAENPEVQQKLSRWLREATKKGEKFLEAEEDPSLADLLWWKGEKVLVVEASLKVNGSDVLRAHRRAQTLRQVGVDAVAVVVGEDWASLEARELAKEKGVWWFVGGVPSEGLVEFRKLEG